MPRDGGAFGPFPAHSLDVDAINAVFSDAFTNRYHRDGMMGVRVPFLNPAVWRYALACTGVDAMLWREGGATGPVVAFNFVHVSGREGWMGPLAVRADRQGEGLGRLIVQTGIDRLRAHGATTIGLETMPRTVDNIGFYAGLGFRPAYLTVTLARDLVAEPAPSDIRCLSGAGTARDAWIQECDALAHALRPGLTFGRELRHSLDLQLGDAALVSAPEGGLAAFLLWHTVPLALGRGSGEVRVLKAVARDVSSLIHALEVAESTAMVHGARRLLVRCQTRDSEAFARLVARGYRVHWTDLRMTLDGAGEQGGPGLVWSNWEI